MIFLSCKLFGAVLRQHSIGVTVIIAAVLSTAGVNVPVHAASISTPLQLVAVSTNNDNYHAQGITAFNAGNFQEAIRLLEKALALDSENPKLIFNLASAYYKAEQYDNAFKYYPRLINYSAYKPMAFYHLGLIDIKRERYSDAEYWFRKCLSSTSNKKLAKLSRSALRRINESRKAQLKADKKRWKIRISVAGGYDDNVSLSNLEIDNTVQKKDSFTNFSAGASGYLAGNVQNGFHALLSYNNRTYNQESDYDYYIGKVKFSYDLRLGKQYNRLFTQYQQIGLGEDDFQTIFSGGMYTQFLVSNQRWLKLNYQFSQYDADNQKYNYLNGQQHLLFVKLIKQTPDTKYSIKYQIENNTRDDLMLSNQYFDASPVRHTISWRMRLFHFYAWDLSTELGFRKSIYDRNNIFVNGNTTQRDDERATFSLVSNIWLNHNWTLRASYQYSENNSNINVYSYSRNIVKFGLSYKY